MLLDELACRVITNDRLLRLATGDLLQKLVNDLALAVPGSPVVKSPSFSSAHGTVNA